MIGAVDLGPSRELMYRIGQVAIQFAYLEDELQDLLIEAEPLMMMPKGNATWDDYYAASCFANRAEFLGSQLFKACDRLTPSTTLQIHRGTIKRTLDQCVDAARRRNEILHSPSVDDAASGPVVEAKGRRPSKPSTPMTAQDVAGFVTHLSTVQNHVRSLRFEVDWLIQAMAASKP
jgi:hypothetical protein